jgi:hypothetical protein
MVLLAFGRRRGINPNMICSDLSLTLTLTLTLTHGLIVLFIVRDEILDKHVQKVRSAKRNFLIITPALLPYHRYLSVER